MDQNWDLKKKARCNMCQKQLEKLNWLLAVTLELLLIQV